MKQDNKYTPKRIVEEGLFFSIPIYQRLFEWDEENVTQLLEDVLRAMKTSSNEDYFIGMLTGDRKDEKIDLVDGQQRFSIMMLLGSVCQKYDDRWKLFLQDREGMKRLKFSSRPKDDFYLKEIINGEWEESQKANLKMKSALNVISQFLNSRLNIARELAGFIYEHLSFFISYLPDGYSATALNTYFERMNSTGRNLENHEILKVKLLANLGDEAPKYINLWNKIADIDTLVVRKRSEEKDADFNQRKENAIWYALNSFISLLDDNNNILNGLSNSENIVFQSIKEIRPSERRPNISGITFRESRCPINFPTLLLLTLFWTLQGKIQSSIQNFFNQFNLLDTFKKYLPFEGDNVNKNKIITFMQNLTFCRLIMDVCFIRPTDYGFELDMNRPEGDKEAKKLLMFESVLYVSSSNYTNYRWFCWLMDAVKEEGNIPDSSTLRMYLEEKDRTLDEHALPSPENMCYRKINRYWFYILDYIIWSKRNDLFKDTSEALSVAERFVFSSSRSIEHIAPQHPQQDSSIQWDNDNPDDMSIMNSFGNMAMISQGLNSALSNSSYEMKRAQVESYCNMSKTGSIESLKLLTAFVDNKGSWNRETIIEHGKKMYNMLDKYFNK